MKKYKFARLINDIINRKYNCQFSTDTMNNKFVWWAYKKGYVQIISATQQQWTEKGAEWYTNTKNAIKGETITF